MDQHKNIALFIDGTWNAPSGKTETNVWKLFNWVRNKASDKQIAYYIPGVGEDMTQVESTDDPAIREKLRPSQCFASKLENVLLGGACGLGTTARIKEAYAFISHHYVTGDRVYMFGFSRGAFAVRSLAGFMSKVGILFKDHLDLVDGAYRLYELDIDIQHTALSAYVRKWLKRGLIDESGEDKSVLPIHLIGVWDTVGALGLPRRLAAFSAPFTEYHQVTLPPNVAAARHAIALHEMRKDFKVILWSNPYEHQDLMQVWFPGNHGDIGGGYPTDECGYSNKTLLWMADQAQKKSLVINTKNSAVPCILHQEWKWHILGAPEIRSQLVLLAQFGTASREHFALFDESVKSYLINPKAGLYKRLKNLIQPRLTEVDDLTLSVMLCNCLGHKLGTFDSVNVSWTQVRVRPLRAIKLLLNDFLREIRTEPLKNWFSPDYDTCCAVAAMLLLDSQAFKDNVASLPPNSNTDRLIAILKSCDNPLSLPSVAGKLHSSYPYVNVAKNIAARNLGKEYEQNCLPPRDYSRGGARTPSR